LIRFRCQDDQVLTRVTRVARYSNFEERSVFEGELSAAQHRSLTPALRQQLDPAYDSIRIYRIGTPHLVQVETLGAQLGRPNSVF